MTAIVVVPAYDCVPWFAQCLASIQEQAYDDMRVVVVDDCSTSAEQREVIASLNQIPGWVGIVNKQRQMCPRNIFEAVHQHSHAEPDDIVILCDGDDRFAHPNAVARIMAEYDAYPDCLVTYGSYTSDPYDESCPAVEPYPWYVIRNRAFRGYSTAYNHPLSFKVEAFDQLEATDLQFDDGTWFDAAYDQTIMYPLLELAGPNHRFIPDALYVYTSSNPASESRVLRDRTEEVAQSLFARPKKPRMFRENGQTVLVDDSRRVLAAELLHHHDLSDVVDQGSRAGKVAPWSTVETFRFVADLDLYRFAVACGGVRPIYGELTEELPYVSDGIPPALWWLDGLAPGYVMDALFQIVARGEPRDVIVVDDAPTVGVDEVRGQMSQLCEAYGCAYDVVVQHDVIRITPEEVS